jgi:curved DNA-binding protein CbpA
MNTLYNLLRISPDADNETLKKAFREAVKATHPDIHADDPDALSRFRKIVAANAVLRDAKQRARYDWLLQQRFRLKPEYPQHQLKRERRHIEEDAHDRHPGDRRCRPHCRAGAWI